MLAGGKFSVTECGQIRIATECAGNFASGSDPGRIRTCDQRFRKPLLYPAELRGPPAFNKPVDDQFFPFVAC